MTVTMILPFADPSAPKEAPSANPAQLQRPWRAVPETPVLGLIDNGKLKADKLLYAVGDALIARGAIERYVLYKKPSLEPIAGDALDGLLGEAHLVVSAMGDCGGCTASSTTDALRCCEQGVPAFVVATDRFKFLVEATDDAYPIQGLNKLYVDHPIWKRDDAWFAATGEALADQVLAALGRGAAVAATGAETSKGSAAPSVDKASIDAVLSDLRAGMNSDGYDMDVDVRGDALAIKVRAREGAGKLCLMPEPAFAQYVFRALDGAGVGVAAEKIRVTYPPPSPTAA
jgi:hypothetical protein